jgi:hypothetical protein
MMSDSNPHDGFEISMEISIDSLGDYIGHKAKYRGWEGKISIGTDGKPVFSFLGGTIPLMEGESIGLYSGKDITEYTLIDESLDSAFYELGKSNRFDHGLELPTDDDESSLLGDIDFSPEAGEQLAGSETCEVGPDDIIDSYPGIIGEVKKNIRKGSDRFKALKKKVEEEQNGSETT